MLQAMLNTKLKPNMLEISAPKCIVKPACGSIYSRGSHGKEDWKLTDSLAT